MIEITPSRSGMIKKLSYNEGELVITFEKGGEYKYKDFPKEAFNDLINSESIGKHFHAHIKNKFESEKL